LNKIFSYACVIPSTGRRSLYTKTIPSLFRQQKPFDQIIVVFDLDEKNCPNNNFPGVINLYTGGGKGGPYAQNIGFNVTTAMYVVLLDDDDELDEFFLSSLDDLLVKANKTPDLLIPKVHKIWLDNLIPSQMIAPPSSLLDSNNLLCTSKKTEWTPYTCSGLVVNKVNYNGLPLNPNIRGFNDLQIFRNIFNEKNSSILYSERSVVRFYQYFSSDRKTSSYVNRKEALEQAKMLGLLFSDAEQSRILIGALFSEARKIAHVQGVRSSFNFIFKDNRSDFILYKSKNSFSRLLINFAFIFWISFFRLFLGKK